MHIEPPVRLAHFQAASGHIDVNIDRLPHLSVKIV